MMERSASLKIVCKRRALSFLDLPPEIRNQIYDLALIKDAPINLCPPSTISRKNSIMAEKVSVLPEYEVFRTPKLTRELQRRERSLEPFGSSFRLQKDLLYVRQQLAPGLLQTCRQINTESAGYFYSRNTWQFMEDEDWSVFFRFLITIGPQNRAHIKNLEVFAPIAGVPKQYEHLSAYVGMPTKNHPKLHMMKTSHSSHKRTCSCCIENAFKLLTQTKTLERIKFVVPRGSIVYGLNKNRAPTLFWAGFLPKVTLEFLPGALLSRDFCEMSVQHFTDRGVCSHFFSYLSPLISYMLDRALYACLKLARWKLTRIFTSGT